jgi:hypothetical protein
MELLLELNKFDHIKYHDEPHHYYIGDKLLTSATTFIGKFKNKFDSDGQATKYANKHGLIKEEVLAEWDHKRDYSTIKGSAVHDYAENHWNNKIFPYHQLRLIVLVKTLLNRHMINVLNYLIIFITIVKQT